MTDSEEDDYVPCWYCNEPIDSSPEGPRRWILLNRYAIGTGEGRCMSEGLNDYGEYEWETSEDVEEEVATGALLHWPVCAMCWIEGKMIETDYELKKTEL